MVGQGYTRTDADHCVYVRQFSNGKFIILLLYVDDMLIVGPKANMVGSLKKELFKSFDMKDLGPTRQILGMHILRDRKAKKLWLSKEKNVERVLERFNMKHAKPVSTPLGGHFKLSKKSCPSSNKEKENGINSLFLCSQEFDVCHGLHMARHCSYSWYSQQVHG